MKPPFFRMGGVLLGALAVVITVPAAAQRPHSTEPLDWLIQHVCARGPGEVVPADPYEGCPEGSSERRLGLSDPLPYFRHDQPGERGVHPHGYQRHDARPLADVKYGGTISANDFDFDYDAPYGVMRPGEGDGYDVYRIADGYVTSEGTRDGGGYSQTFFGPACKPYGGWTFFPVSFLRALSSPGQAVFPIYDEYWEQKGEPWPGRCPPVRALNASTLTTWEFVPAFAFGGYNGSRRKTLDAILSTHGLPVDSRARARAAYHLERFYFTDLYGLTRWESWVPAAASPPAPKGCAGPMQLVYQGASYALAHCRDWSAVDLLSPPQRAAAWPYPQANLLRNWHFDGASLAPWRKASPSAAGAKLNAALSASRAYDDTRYAARNGGVRFLEITCAGASCGSLYQDVAVADLPCAKIGGCTRPVAYDYGFSGSGDGAADVRVTLSQVDAHGTALSTAAFDAHLEAAPPKAGTRRSVYKDSQFHVATSPPIAISPRTTSLRFSLSALSPARIDVLDAWLMARPD